ncbi:DUF1453 family protein [Amycolatopsis cihanbeyliensis]|uniref:Uncharacterized protein DUF1453 n=1 Tax=Amycolatopsis cihanbeyliensis TaxID=1128664 RepID=A0A542DCP1_AMYCI|nr:DUF1453 family protein [Amycolatopsis cihanbeyliensis]TQJ00841.1 uncharacterized protein DUF1453 [Amycolatopsis cihanbeyliensis]
MSTWLVIVLVGVVGFAIVRRFLGEPLTAREVFVLPLVLLGVGGFSLREVPVTGTDVLWLGIGGFIGCGLGYLRGRTVRLLRRDGVLWQRYTGWTVLVWVASIVVNGGIGLLAEQWGMNPEARPMPLLIGISLLGEMACLALRARALGVPYAPERR